MAGPKQKDAPKKSMITIYMEDEFIQEIDVIVAENGFKSRNQAIRLCLIDFINERHPTVKEIAEM